MPVIGFDDPFNYSLSELLEFANGVESINRPQAEGVVFKNNSNPNASFKVLSNAYLLAEKD